MIHYVYVIIYDIIISMISYKYSLISHAMSWVTRFLRYMISYMISCSLI